MHFIIVVKYKKTILRHNETSSPAVASLLFNSESIIQGGGSIGGIINNDKLIYSY